MIKGERIWTTYSDIKGTMKYVITSKKNDRTVYFLYKISDGKYERVGKNKDLTVLDEVAMKGLK